MQNYQANIEDLSKCTVAIQEPVENGRILGTGVIVTDDGLILTCYHVVGNIKNKTLDHKTVDIYFPAILNVKGHANVSEKYSDSSLDIAFLQLQEKLPEQISVANLSETIDSRHTFQSFGFRKPLDFKGLNAAGEIRGKVRKKSSNGNNTEPQELIQLHSNEIGPGMSGSPVLDEQINRVIGIASEHYRSQSDVDNNLSFAIPINTIIEKSKVASILREKNPGLLKITKFLEKIGLAAVKNYRRIDDLFVPPIEYDAICNALKANQVVFITGPPEYGKTYTAIRLLWEYFNDGYEPVYFPWVEKNDRYND